MNYGIFKMHFDIVFNFKTTACYSSLPQFRNGVELCTVLCWENQTTAMLRDYLGRLLSTHLPRYNLLVNLNRLVCKEGGVTSSHLIYQHSQSPPVHCFIVTLENTKEITGDQTSPQTKTLIHSRADNKQ